MNIFPRLKGIIVIVSFSLMAILGCRNSKPGSHYHITVVNNSDKDILVTDYAAYPVEICYELMQTYNNSHHLKVKAHSNSNSALSTPWYYTWEDLISGYKSKKAAIFIFDSDSLEYICTRDTTINWSYIYDEKERDSVYDNLNKRVLLSRLYVSIDDLNKMNWTITYP